MVPNYYLVNNFGEVKNIKGQYLKPILINSGYLVYALYTGRSNPKYKRVLAHRLVKMYFDPIENPEDYTVNHDDMDKLNNWEDNLTWMTQSENNMERERNYHLYGTGNYHAAFNLSQLKIILEELDKGTRYKDILNIIGVEDTENNRDYIGNIKRGRTYQREIQLLNG